MLISTGTSYIRNFHSGETKKFTEEDKKNLAAKNRREVVGRFKYYDNVGGTHRFTCVIDQGDPEDRVFTLVDEGVYRLPLGVAKMLNEEGWYPIRRELKDYKDTLNIDATDPRRYEITEKRQRYGFVPLGFDQDHLDVTTPDILTVNQMVEFGKHDTHDNLGISKKIDLDAAPIGYSNKRLVVPKEPEAKKD